VNAATTSRGRGFTMVELIVVMVLMGILAAIGIPKIMGNSSFSPLALHDQILTAMRYAQKTAVSHRRVVCATQPNIYTINFNIASAPGATSCGTIVLVNPIDITVSGATPVTYTDNFGSTLFFQPDGTITADLAGTTPRSGAISINGEGATYTIRIDGETGYVD
jgi:MSHA pilin protein MshC